MSSPIEVDVYASKLSDELSVNKEALLAEIEKNKKYLKKNRQIENFKEIRRSFDKPNDLINKVNPERRNNLHCAKAEEILIATVMSNPALHKAVFAKIGADDFVTPFNAKVFGAICNRISESRGVDITSLSADFTSDELSVIAGIAANTQFISNSLKECDDCIAVIKSEKVKANSKSPAEMDDADFLNIFNNNWISKTVFTLNKKSDDILYYREPPFTYSPVIVTYIENLKLELQIRSMRD